MKSVLLLLYSQRASLVAQMVKNLPAMQETQVPSLGLEDLLEKRMATNSSILAWRIPWTGEPGGLQSMGSQRVQHDWMINTFTYSQNSFIFFIKMCLSKMLLYILKDKCNCDYDSEICILWFVWMKYKSLYYLVGLMNNWLFCFFFSFLLTF